MTTQTTHDLKVWPKHYQGLVSGDKRFEIRRDDRGFQVGDVLHLQEWKPTIVDGVWNSRGEYTGRELHATVTYIIRGGEQLASEQPYLNLHAGWVIMSIKPWLGELA